MRIDVYFEKPSKVGGNMYATLVAQFCDEDLYTACFPALKKNAKYNGLIVTESIKEDVDLSDEYFEDHRPLPENIQRAFGEHLTVDVEGYEQTVWDIFCWAGIDHVIEFLNGHVHKDGSVGVASDYEHLSEKDLEESIRLNAQKE
jgi:hypothetical protein